MFLCFSIINICVNDFRIPGINVSSISKVVHAIHRALIFIALLSSSLSLPLLVSQDQEQGKKAEDENCS